MRTVDVCFTPGDYSESNIEIAVVIDVLRATSVMIKALAMGASSIMPVITVEEAREIKRKNQNFLLAGERKGFKIDGFDFGNSPEEITKEKVFKKNIIITTSNGTKAINSAKKANTMILASFLNLKIATEYLKNSTGNIKIICSGTNGKPTFEDTLCAGGIVNELSEVNINLTDSAVVSKKTFIENGEDIKSSMLRKSLHAKYLASIGYGIDIDFCAKMNLYDTVPLYVVDRFVRSV